MAYVLVLLMAVGVGAMIGIPIRVFLLARSDIRAEYLGLNLLSKVFVTLGLVGLFLGALSWFGVAYVAVMVYLDDTTPRLWGGSEFGMTTSALGVLYLVVELLLLPLTRHGSRSEEVESA